MKLRFRPLEIPPPVTPPAGPDVLSGELRARVQASPLAFSLEAQRFVDEARTPVEDPSDALVEHRPLGAIMRARGAAYRRAVGLRDVITELEVKPPSALV